MESSGDDVYDAVVVSDLGMRCVRACRPPGAEEPTIKWTDQAALKADIAARRATTSTGQSSSQIIPPTA